MNKAIACIIVLVFVVIYACRTQEQGVEWGWNAERPQKAQDVFSHDTHKEVFDKEGFGCFVCHTAGIKAEGEIAEEEMIKISEGAFFPGKETCHFCHFSPKTGNIAPDSCGICHFNLREIQPANHNFDWVAKHQVYAKADADNCENCHSPRFCEDCHKRRDLPTRRFHDRNFRFVHPIEARANPSSCGNCHELRSFCDKCHIEGGYER